MRSFRSMRSKHGDAAAYEAVHGYAVVLLLGNFVIGAKCFFGVPPSVVFPCCAICVVMNWFGVAMVCADCSDYCVADNIDNKVGWPSWSKAPHSSCGLVRGRGSNPLSTTFYWLCFRRNSFFIGCTIFYFGWLLVSYNTMELFRHADRNTKYEKIQLPFIMSNVLFFQFYSLTVASIKAFWNLVLFCQS